MEAPSRYQKQMLFAPIGSSGQERIAAARVLLVGCGALGCVLADSLTRAGVGHLRIVDRDFVELSNLQRQVLFTESDVERHLPKAIAAAERLQQVNSQIQVESIVEDVTNANIMKLASDVDLILDGTDNFEIRYLINDASLELQTPWIFTGCTGSHGQVMPVIPGRTGCLRCLMPDAPPPGSTETCDTAGVLGPAVIHVASLQAAIALRILVEGKWDPADKECAHPFRKLTLVDPWNLTFRQIDTSGLPDGNCPACCKGERLWLRGERSVQSTVLCGRNAVQVSSDSAMELSLSDLASRLQPFATVMENRFLIRADFADDDLQLTVFSDGRAIVKGTEDPAIARSVVAKWIGS